MLEFDFWTPETKKNQLQKFTSPCSGEESERILPKIKCNHGIYFFFLKFTCTLLVWDYFISSELYWLNTFYSYWKWTFKKVNKSFQGVKPRESLCSRDKTPRKVSKQEPPSKRLPTGRLCPRKTLGKRCKDFKQRNSRWSFFPSLSCKMSTKNI